MRNIHRKTDLNLLTVDILQGPLLFACELIRQLHEKICALSERFVVDFLEKSTHVIRGRHSFSAFVYDSYPTRFVYDSKTGSIQNQD